MRCEGKHTVYQPTDDEWLCPLLHNQDRIICYACDHGTTGIRFAGAILKRKNLVTCPCCNGKGIVNGEPETTG